MFKYISCMILCLCLVCINHSYAIQDDLLNKAFKKSFEYHHQVDLGGARSATTVGNEVFKSSVGISLDLENLGSDPKICIANGKLLTTDLAKEICNTQYSGTFTDDFMCLYKGLNIPLVSQQCLPTDPNYNSQACIQNRTKDCQTLGGTYIAPPVGTCYQWNMFKGSIREGEVPVENAKDEEDCLNPKFFPSLVSSNRRRDQKGHCVLPDASIKTISEADKKAYCEALGGEYKEPATIDFNKTDPLIIRIIKFIIRMTVLIGLSVFIYIGITYILSYTSGSDIYESEKVRLLIQIGAGILVALLSLSILYLILSVTGSGSDIIKSLSD